MIYEQLSPHIVINNHGEIDRGDIKTIGSKGTFKRKTTNKSILELAGAVTTLYR